MHSLPVYTIAAWPSAYSSLSLATDEASDKQIYNITIDTGTGGQENCSFELENPFIVLTEIGGTGNLNTIEGQLGALI